MPSEACENGNSALLIVQAHLNSLRMFPDKKYLGELKDTELGGASWCLCFEDNTVCPTWASKLDSKKECPLLYCTQWEDCPGERERACGEHQAGLEALRCVCQAFGFMRQQLPKVREWARPAKLSYSCSMGLRLGLGLGGLSQSQPMTESLSSA